MQVYASDGRPLPLVTPTSQPFFDAACEGRLVMQLCPRDGYFFYPRSHCPHCLQSDWTWEEAPTEATIYAYTIERTGQDPAQRNRVPFAIAVVDLAAGPRMIGNVIDCPLEHVAVGMSVSVFFAIVDGTPIVCFRPVQTKAPAGRSPAAAQLFAPG